MKRREFLKTATVLTVCALAPVAASSPLLNRRISQDEPIPNIGEEKPPIFEHAFEPAGEYGRAFAYGHDAELEDIKKIMSFAIIDAKASLPVGTVFEIRQKIPTDFGRDLGLAWYHVASMKRKPLIQHGINNPFFDRDAGYILIARIKA